MRLFPTIIVLILILFLSLFFFNKKMGCDFYFPDLSQKQAFECKSKSGFTYKTKIKLKGEVSDTVQMFITKYAEILGSTFVESHELTGVVDTSIKIDWQAGYILIGTIQPSPITTGHLKLRCEFMTEYF